MDVATALQHLARLRERFQASLTPQQRAWQLEIDDADNDSRMAASEQLEDELVRHLAPPYPVLRLLYGHLTSQTFADIGKCCRSPEEISDEWDAQHGSGAKS